MAPAPEIPPNGLTPEERAVLAKLAGAWNVYCKLPERTEANTREFCEGIHRAQAILALRVARRANPETWR